MSYSRNNSQDLVYNTYINTYVLASTLYTLTVNPTPADATVTFTGGTASSNTVSGTYNTSVTYTVSRTGYATRSGSTTLNHDQTVNVPLTPNNYTLTINPTPGDAMVTLTASGYSQVGNSITVPYQTQVEYEVRKNHYSTESGRVTVTQDQTLNITVEYVSDPTKTGGGGGQPTFLKLNNVMNTKLFGWFDGVSAFYTLNSSPSPKEPLYNFQGVKITGYELTGKTQSYIVIKNLSNNTSTNATRDSSRDIFKDITNGTFYKNGGGGAAGNGEDWSVGSWVARSKGGAGGGYYWLNTETLDITSVPGRDQGSNLDGAEPGFFPSVHSGKGGPSGVDSGATVINGRTDYKLGSGASGSDSALNPQGASSTAFYGSGGGGAGGDMDASGGRCGYGNSTYETNTTGENATNYHTTPTASTNYLGEPSTLGQGGLPFIGTASATNGGNGWLYIYRFENVIQTLDMGTIGAEPAALTINAGALIDTNITDTYDGGTDFDTSNYLDGGPLYYPEDSLDCGNISDTTIAETIQLGHI